VAGTNQLKAQDGKGDDGDLRMWRPSRFEGAAVGLLVMALPFRMLSYYWAGNAVGNLYIDSAIACFGAGLALLVYYYSSTLLSRSRVSSKASKA
jgi:hypothetical protein